jgi:hypothetical protein
MHNNIGLSKLGESIYPYPTYAEAFRAMADAYNRTKLKPTVKSIMRSIFF